MTLRGTTCISRPPSINTDWSLIFSFTDDDDNEEEEEKEKEEGEKEEEKEEEEEEKEEDGGNREADQDGIRRAHSTSSVVEKGPIDQSQFERNKILIRGLSEKTCPDGLVNFIEARSGGKEVKDVQMLKNGKALVTMADEIKGTFLSIKSRE